LSDLIKELMPLGIVHEFMIEPVDNSNLHAMMFHRKFMWLFNKPSTKY